MALKAGTVQKFDEDSMARAMEKAFKIEWRKFMGIGLPKGMEVYWRMFFVAVSQGVIKHLKEQVGDSFRIDVGVRQVIVTDEEETGDGAKPAIESRNPNDIGMQYLESGWGGGYGSNYGIKAEQGLFVQVPDEENRIWSEGGTTVGEGGGTVVEVETAGELYNYPPAP